MARHASGGRQGLAQGIFQVGGQTGGALGPLLAALIIVPHGQASLAWFAVAAILAIALMVWSARQHSVIRKEIAAAASTLSDAAARAVPHSPRAIAVGLVTLTLIMFSKNVYIESFRSFYTFYLMDRFDVSIQASQLMLFVFLVASAVGALVGGIVGDRIGRHRIIWISVLGPLPLTLSCPTLICSGRRVDHPDQPDHGQRLRIDPDLRDRTGAPRIGLVGGLFYGLNFGLRWHRRGHARRPGGSDRHRARLSNLFVHATRRSVGLVPPTDRRTPTPTNGYGDQTGRQKFRHLN